MSARQVQKRVARVRAAALGHPRHRPLEGVAVQVRGRGKEAGPQRWPAGVGDAGRDCGDAARRRRWSTRDVLGPAILGAGRRAAQSRRHRHPRLTRNYVQTYAKAKAQT